MVIIQQPDVVSLSGNLKSFIISSSGAILFTLTQGGETVLEQRYQPNQDGRIEIDLRDVIESRLYYELRDVGTAYVQPGIVSNFTATIGNNDYTFRVLRGGVERLQGSAETFLASNFLTWQPTLKRVTYYTPEFLTYYATSDCVAKLRAYITDESGNVTSHTDYTIASLTSGTATTLPLQYGNVVGWLDGELPAWYDVWIERSGNRLTYIQRYVCDIQLSVDEDWVLFENSLGGIDTLRAYGDLELKAEHTHNVADVDGSHVEYRVDTERIYQKNTGQLSKAEAQWLLDYPPSSCKYIYMGGSMRKIVVTSSDLSGKLRTEPTSYGFTFKFADARPLLNLQRGDVPAQMLNIVVPDLGNFSLPPRLAEFPGQPLSEGVLFPVQSPYSENWGVASFAALAAAIATYIEASGGGGGSNVDIIGENGTETPSDFNVFSALRVLKEIQKCTSRQQLLEVLQGNFLRKDQPDQTNYLMKFLGGLEVGQAVDSMLAGRGIIATPDGRLQVGTLEVRNALKVMSLIIQEIHGLQGDYLFSDVGDVTAVDQIDATTYRLTIDKRSSTDITTLDEGDVLYQIVNNLLQGGSDYYTSWMRVVTRNTANNTIDVVLWADNQVDGGTNYPPTVGYTVARRGNVNALLDPTNYGERGSLWQLSSREQRLMLLADVVKPVLEDFNYKLVLGKLPNIRALQNYPVRGDIGLMAQTVVAEKLLQFDWNGDVVVNKPDRGDWSLAVAQSDAPYRCITYEQVIEGGTQTTVAEQHTVRHLGCVWGCLIDRTTLEPKWNSQGWTLLEGLRGLTLELVATNTAFYNRATVDTEVTPTLFYGQMDISSDVLQNDWSWIRVSSGTDAQFDAAWNAAHVGNGRTLHITGADLPPNWGRSNPCKFVITAYVRVGEDNVQSAQNTVNF